MWDLELGEQDKQVLLRILVQQQQLMAELNIQASAIQLTAQELVNGPTTSNPRFDNSGERAERNGEVRTPHVMHAGQPKPVHSLRASGDPINSPANTVDIVQQPPSPSEGVINKMAVHEMFHVHVDQSTTLQDQPINTHTSCLTSAPKTQQLMDASVNGLSDKSHPDDVMVGGTQHDHNPLQALHRSEEHYSTDNTIQSRFVLPIHPKTQPQVLPEINQNMHTGSPTSRLNRCDPQSTGFAERSMDTRRWKLQFFSSGGEDLRQTTITFLLCDRLQTLQFKSSSHHSPQDQFYLQGGTVLWSRRNVQRWPWDPGPSRVSREVYVVRLQHQHQLDSSHAVILPKTSTVASTN